MQVKKIAEVEYMSNDSVFIKNTQYVSQAKLEELTKIWSDIIKDIQEKVISLEKENRTLKDYIEILESRR